jgi:DNA-binding NarL/FixJ family response regulator
MARLLALTADLMFGSRLISSLGAAGHEVELVASEDELRAALAPGDAQGLLVDLTDEQLGAARIVEALTGELSGMRTLAYYSHVDPSARERGLQAGVERAVPRSRIAREAPDLVAALLEGGR